MSDAVSFTGNMGRSYYVLPNGRAIRISDTLFECRPEIITENKQNKQQRVEVFMTQDEVDVKYQWMGAFMVMFGALSKGYGRAVHAHERDFLTTHQRQHITRDIIGSVLTDADSAYKHGILLGQKTIVLSENLCMGLIPTTIASGLRSPELKIEKMYPLKNLRKRSKSMVRVYAEKDEACRYGTYLSRMFLMIVAGLFGKEYDSAEWYLTEDKCLRPVVCVMDNIGLSIVIAPYVVGRQ